MALAVGATIGSYMINARLGAGGMGEVYRATDTKLKREVAIKSLPDALTRNPVQIARFQQEAEVLASLNHPHIAAIYDLIEVEGSTYLVLELVEGDTLAERLARGRPSLEEALRWAKQLAEALEAAHERGVVHRDLKPPNIKITRGGMAKLLDFGIAKRQAFEDAEKTKGSGLTIVGEIVGTAGYMSPEQVLGDTVDFRSDQFSLGVVLFEMIAGRRPFVGNSVPETLASILRDEPPILGELNGATPPPVQWIVERCLAKDPRARYDSTGDLARDLATLGDRVVRPKTIGKPLLKPSSLPVPRTMLVGRDEALARARSLILREDVCLITFTGAGGTGKTRVALQAAANVREAFPGGVFFVALASITDPTLVAPTLAQALCAGDISARDPVDALKEALRSARNPVLLVLDNFEQVIDAAPLVTDLLENCALLKTLITSRAVLRVYGEHEFRVAPLELPEREERPVLDRLSQCPSVALFLQRAVAVKPDFALTAENAACVAEICVRLDGLPLAIELAAARVRTLNPKAMLQRMKSRFELLTGGARDLPARQQTLRAAVEWSYGLLTEEEQKLLRRMAVFVNGCTLEAVEAVCDAREDLGGNVLDGIESLAGKSLIQQTQPPNAETRFTMLETIREYAAERLASSADEAISRRAHAAYFLVLAEESSPFLTPVERATWIDRCDLELDNFRAVFDWVMRTRSIEWGLRVGAALFPYWGARSLFGEGHDRVKAVLDLPESEKVDPKVRARALHSTGDCMAGHGHVGAQRFHTQALEIYRAIGDVAGVVAVLNSIGASQQFMGNLEEARVNFQECLQLLEEARDERGIAQVLNNLAVIRRDTGDFTEAKQLCEQALVIFNRREDFSGAAYMQGTLGDLERQLGNLTAAKSWYDKAVEGFKRIGDQSGVTRIMVDVGTLLFERGERREGQAILAQALKSFRDMGNRQGTARALEEFAGIAADKGQVLRAMHLASAAAAVRHPWMGRSILKDRPSLLRKLDAVRQTLGPAALDAEMYGWSMTLEAAIEYALNDDTTESSQDR